MASKPILAAAFAGAVIGALAGTALFGLWALLLKLWALARWYGDARQRPSEVTGTVIIYGAIAVANLLVIAIMLGVVFGLTWADAYFSWFHVGSFGLGFLFCACLLYLAEKREKAEKRQAEEDGAIDADFQDQR